MLSEVDCIGVSLWTTDASRPRVRHIWRMRATAYDAEPVHLEADIAAVKSARGPRPAKTSLFLMCTSGRRSRNEQCTIVGTVQRSGSNAVAGRAGLRPDYLHGAFS
jgi:hypothetical protein